MKQKHLLSLLQSGYTTVNVCFPSDSGKRQEAPIAGKRAPWDDSRPWLDGQHTAQPRGYVYKTRDMSLTAGDRVIVQRDTDPTGFTIAVVMSLDPSPRIDVDADFDYKWIVQKVDTADYAATMEAERQFKDQLQEVERQHQRDQLMQKMTEHLPADSPARALFDAAVQRFAAPALAQATIGAQPAAPQAMPQQTAAVPEQQIGGVACK